MSTICRSPQKTTKDNLPGYEGNFVPSATALFLIFKVIDCPSTFILWKNLKEFFVISMPSSLDDDLAQIFTKVEDNVLIFLLQFEILEYGIALGADRDT